MPVFCGAKVKSLAVSIFGLKVGVVGTIGFETRIIAGMPKFAGIMEPLPAARQKLHETFTALHRELLSIVRDDEVRRRLMTIPGVGPVVSLAFTSSIDVPTGRANVPTPKKSKTRERHQRRKMWNSSNLLDLNPPN